MNLTHTVAAWRQQVSDEPHSHGGNKRSVSLRWTSLTRWQQEISKSRMNLTHTVAAWRQQVSDEPDVNTSNCNAKIFRQWEMHPSINVGPTFKFQKIYTSKKQHFSLIQTPFIVGRHQGMLLQKDLRTAIFLSFILCRERSRLRIFGKRVFLVIEYSYLRLCCD